MKCPQCNFEDNTVDAICCGGCGQGLVPPQPLTEAAIDGPPNQTCELKLEVRFGEPTPDAPCCLFARLTNHRTALAAVHFSIDCETLDESLSQRMHQLKLRPNAQHIFNDNFNATPGHHLIHFTVVLDDRPFCGWADLNIPTPQQRVINFQGPVVHNQGDYMVGDHQLAMTISLADGQPIRANEFVEIALQPQTHGPTAVVRKQRFQPRQYRPAGSNRLILCLKLGERGRRLHILGGRSHLVGRGRAVDLRLRVPPQDDPTEKKTERISREHAQIAFDAQGVRWIEKSTLGTEVCGATPPNHYITKPDARTWRRRIKLSPANVLPLDCRGFEDQLPMSDHELYKRFVQHELGNAYVDAVGPVQAVGIQREDSWAAEQEYLLLQHSALIGTGNHCAVQVLGSQLQAAHAYLHFLGGGFWLEKVQPTCEITVNGQPLLEDKLLPLVPHMAIELPGLSISTETWPQD